ncbi:uncharacterized protein K452DRAFT_312603 [Aplosporella prunicola CBS 121167]|uniref:Uncharacterized protein n=1 Tax=Aplosporella prunicola CBS 121167 TaxID=1176127 RepID=A0A6A6B367_9PEZI|nr:uncharacterized protein K452DRAFT_312603 [Aplosporella prunicola CBS 121167]KAF2137171.1 hypothetical protein K452DRAFT_312603 [Aplosporella prunicola CBS 121167]
MKYAFAPLALGLTASAAVIRRDQCCFQLNASGGTSGTLGQLSDGQNRVGGNHSPATYCLNNGAITDKNGRGCILTPPTTQFQCDTGASPTPGFAVGEGGSLTYNGNTKFYACPAADDQFNIYTKPVDNQSKCVEITLSTGGQCAASSSAAPSTPASTPAASQPAPSSPVASQPAPSSPAASQPAPSSPAAVTTPEIVTATKTFTTTSPCSTSTPAAATTPAASTPVASAPAPSGTGSSSNECPKDLQGDYQYPHLIVPVNSTTPDQAYGTSYNGEISSHVCSTFNFDIPQSYEGSTCSVVFLFPKKEDLETSNYTVSGSGSAKFSELSSAVSQETTWKTVPETSKDLGSISLEAGNGYTITSGECQAGKTVSYEICGEGSFSLNYFQDYNPSPLGLYVRKC